MPRRGERLGRATLLHASARAGGRRAPVLGLGFDASGHEPPGFLRVTEDGCAGEAVAALRLPAAIVQEGGYDVEALGPLLRRILAAFA